ncbi:aquaporin Z [Nostocaceae cyanobacterium CENA369]|uniref:Aquaporin Z n=1 Tax=Dendronalium phyllosphericum CENA369 TaxID=1725256 RepID=A0A8J7IEY3_9NOST|nr:aquaporin Z [Dendronalium phyllosphericum]MBH8578440.1 aquaporin Z [Dendronalium phyllosphericum CENA369]
MVSLLTRCIAEFVGTFVLVLAGCGSAVFAAAFPDIKTNELGIGFVGVALAFGLALLTMAYAIAHISGCHLNPAVSFGLWSGNRFPSSDLLPYIVSQVLGAIVAAGLVYAIATGKPGFTLSGSNPLATNGYGVHSPGGFSLASCFITELVLTFIFLIVILGATDGRAPKGFAPIAIGLALTLIHLVSIPITNTSVNPARSTGPALFVGAEMFRQIWMFWIAPILGAILAGLFYSRVLGESGAPVVGEPQPR